MKKYQIIVPLTVLAIIAAAITSLTLLLRGTATPKQPTAAPAQPRQTQGQVHFTSKPPASQENSETSASQAASSAYIIREYKGHIGVFRDGEPEPFQELDVLFDTLPPSDRALLTKGIHAETEAQLRSLLEDYAS